MLLFGRTAKRTCQDNRAAIPVKNPMSRNEVATARANIVAAMPRELHPIDVLADFLGSGDFPVEIAVPDAAASMKNSATCQPFIMLYPVICCFCWSSERPPFACSAVETRQYPNTRTGLACHSRKQGKTSGKRASA